MIVNMHEAKTQLSRLVARDLRRRSHRCQNGKPLVRLQPVSAPTGTRKPGLSRGSIEIGPDFGAPLPDDYIRGFES